MLRRVTVLMSLVLVSPAITAQSVFDDFEGNGNIVTWFGDDCGMNATIGNPYNQGSNTSTTVLEYHDQGGQYANVRFDAANNFIFNSGHTFSVDVYVPSAGLTGSQPNQLSLKLQDGTLGQPWTTQSEIIKPIVLDQWQTLTFDWVNDNWVNLDPGSADPSTRTDFNRVLFQFNGEDNNDMVLAYIDNVSYDGILDTAGNQPPVLYDQLVWADEFDTPGMIDTSKWFHQTLLPNGSSWYNGELQHYTDRTDNSYVDQGNLHIVAKSESFTDQGVNKQYTSARLNSKFAFTYGRIEVRAKLPTGAGTWPAIWTLGKNIDEPGAYWTDDYGTTPWPACGEMDVMEHWGVNQDHISSAVHTPSSFGGTVNTGGLNLPGVSNNFNVYALDWYPDRLDFSVNGFIFYTYEPTVQDMATWPFIAEQYILLNVAINPDITSAFVESDMVIDYVRVYQSSAVGLEESKSEPEVKVYPNPHINDFMIDVEQGTSGREAHIFSSTGILIQSLRLDAGVNHIYTEGWAKGLYFLHTQGNKSTPIRLVKM